MPNEGIAYHVDDLWRSRVRERLDELKKTQSWLAQESGCHRSMISELLSGKRHASTDLPGIHKALKWPPPLGPLLSKDDEEVVFMARALGHEQRARLKERMLALREEQERSKSNPEADKPAKRK